MCRGKFRENFHSDYGDKLKRGLGKFKKSIILLFIAKFSFAFAQNYNIDYCGIKSAQLDSNMSKITSDLYYNQLSEIHDFTVTDRRPDFQQDFDSADFSQTGVSFYVEIKKNDASDKWFSIFHVINGVSQEEVTKSKEYDSYYKILMEPKAILQETIKELITNNISGTFTQTASKNQTPSDITTSALSTEFLSGSWKGEEYINKIVIMKGGRGFVIFSNGASMNIQIQFTDKEDGQKITVTQNQRSNASFFPNLPRQSALEHAVNAEPIQWIFSAIDTNTLKGQKRTLGENEGKIAYVDIPVEWSRIN